jgi:hypothetical protein
MDSLVYYYGKWTTKLTCSLNNNMYMKKLTKIKLTTNLKLTCTQIIQSLKKVASKKNHSCSKNERMKHKINIKSKVLKQVYPPSFIISISKYNIHN